MAKDANAQEIFQLNKPRSIVPPMANVVGDTHAETRDEYEARRRAELGQVLPPTPAPATPEPAPKTSLWFIILSVVFAIIAIAGAGFGIYQYTENDKLRTTNASLEAELKTASSELTRTKRLYSDASLELEALKALLEEQSAEEVEDDNPASESNFRSDATPSTSDPSAQNQNAQTSAE